MSVSRVAPLLLVGVAVGAVGGWAVARGSGGEDRGAVLEQLTARQDERLEAVASLVEEDARAAQESALQQFYLLQSFRQVGVDGQEVVWVVPREEADLSAVSGAIRIPRLAVDARARDAWSESVARLDARRDQVDPAVVDAFRTVQAFVEAHPWPSGTGLAAATDSEWGRPDVIESWLTANRALVSRVDGVLSGF